jgi:hypothetical protein
MTALGLALFALAQDGSVGTWSYEPGSDRGGVALLRIDIPLPEGAILECALSRVQRTFHNAAFVEATNLETLSVLVEASKGKAEARVPLRAAGAYVARISFRRHLQEHARIIDAMQRTPEFERTGRVFLGTPQVVIGSLQAALDEAERATARLEKSIPKSEKMGLKAASELFASMMADFKAAADRSILSATFLTHHDLARRMHGRFCIDGVSRPSGPAAPVPQSSGLGENDKTQLPVQVPAGPSPDSAREDSPRLDELRRLAANESALVLAECLTQAGLSEARFREGLKLGVDWHEGQSRRQPRFPDWTPQMAAFLKKAAESLRDPSTDVKPFRDELARLLPFLTSISK